MSSGPLENFTLPQHLSDLTLVFWRAFQRQASGPSSWALS